MESQVEYEINTVNGIEFRCVVPYEHSYLTHCKERWRGLNVYEMFLTEYKAYSPEYYQEAILKGSIQINCKKITLDYTLKNGDTITHKALRNEPAVLNIPIQIVFNSPNLLIVNKPSSIPVHPSGAYYKNSMIYILEHEMGMKNLHLIHRLDRVTCGVMVLAKNKQTAAKLTKIFESNKLRKTYVARVKGNFPYLEKEINEKILCVDFKDGVYKVDPLGKDSITIVKKMFYDKIRDESVLECKLITGRTHQIRVHLSYLGFPIANDVAYGGECINPVQIPDAQFRLIDGPHKLKLEDTKQLEIWLCSYRYIITQNLDFSVPLPDWAKPRPDF